MDRKLSLSEMASEMFRMASELRDKTTATIDFRFHGSGYPIVCEMSFSEKMGTAKETNLYSDENTYRIYLDSLMKWKSDRNFMELSERVEKYLAEYVEPEENKMP